nr:hypothetical protein [Tanacetum cinerariifolium]
MKMEILLEPTSNKLMVDKSYLSWKSCQEDSFKLNLSEHRKLKDGDEGRELNNKGSDIGMILVDPEGKEYSHAVRLNFYAFEDNMDYKALLAGLVTSAK